MFSFYLLLIISKNLIFVNLNYSRFPSLNIVIGHLGERIPSDLLRIDTRTFTINVFLFSPPLLLLVDVLITYINFFFFLVYLLSHGQNFSGNFQAICRRWKRTLPPTSTPTFMKPPLETSLLSFWSSISTKLGWIGLCIPLIIHG